MSNDTFFKCFKQNKIFLINVFWNLGVNTVSFSRFKFIFQKKVSRINLTRLISKNFVNKNAVKHEIWRCQIEIKINQS